MNSKKLVSAVLTATTVLWMVGAASLPLANAQSTASLQAQIAALLAQIQQLQSQLGTSSSGTAAMTYDFTSNLTVGSTGSQVSQLQQLLISDGDLTAVSAPTGYFGALTQAALAKFQAANGITPSVGYFGPKTRAFVNSMSSTSTTTTGTTTTSTGTTTMTAPATGLQVSLASSNPAAGSLISSTGSGSGREPVLAFDLTAGNSGAVTVSSLSFQQNGVLAESAISGAYLTQNGQVVAQYSSLNNDVLTFSGLDISIPAGQTEVYDLDVAVSQGLSAGNTTSFSLPSASDVSAFNSANTAVTATGNFPLNGNTFTVTTVSNPSLAYVSIASSSIGTSVTAGTQGNIVGAWTFNVTNDPVWLQNVNFHVIGSANDANLENVKLLVNGTQVGATLPSVPADGLADFNTTSTSVELNTGSNNVQIVADVMGSPSDDFQFEILNNYDVLAVDSQYNVPVSVSDLGGDGTQVTILTGTITLDQDANTPTGNIAEGTSNTVLAKYDLYAAGEPVKVQWLDFNLDINGVAASSSLSSEIQNVQIVDDAGNQVGTTINTPPSSQTCTPASNAPTSNYGSGGTASVMHAGDIVYADCFGSSGSPINYIVPANTTRVLSLEANIETTASFNTITANLSGDTDNLQGMISSQTGSTSGVNGVALTLVTSSLTATANNALGTQNVSAGTTDLEIGSYALGASSAGGVNVNTVSIKLGQNASDTSAFQNLKLLVNGTQFGTTQGTVSNNGTYTFSGTPFNVPAGQTVDVDVYADTMSSATGTFSPATYLTGFTGVGQVSYTSVSLSNGPITGQAISFNGQPALSVAADSSNPAAGLVAQGTNGQELAVYRFTETSDVENVKVTQMTIVDTVSSSSANFNNVSLWDGSTELGTATAASSTGAHTYNFVFNSFTTPLIVPQGNSVSLTLKGNAGTYTGGSIADDSNSTFSVNVSSIVALGATSNKTANVTGTASGNPQTVLRSIEQVAGTPVTSLPPASFQQIGSITIGSNAAGDTIPNSLTLTFNGTAATGTFMNDLRLEDTNSNQLTPTATTTDTATWNSSILNTYVVSGGGSYTFTLWGNLGDIGPIQQEAQSLTAQIENVGDYTYLDAATGGSTVSLPTTQLPITVVSLTSPVGGEF